MAISALELQRLYLAYFGRPADRDGMDFYLAPGAEWNIFAGPPDTPTAFSASPESRALYGETFGAEQIDAIYMNLFNRHAEQDGIDYWLGQVQKGELTPAGAAYGILVGAKNLDAIAVANKLALCEEFFAAVDTPEEIEAYRGDEVAALIRAYVHSVDHTAESLLNARNALQAKIGEMVEGVVEPPVGSLAFTAGQDDLKGGAGDDTFSAVSGGSAPTFAAADRLDGGEGSDTLKLTLEDAAPDSIEAAQVSGVEVIEVRNLSGERQTIDAQNFQGALFFTAAASEAALIFVHLLDGQSGVVVGGANDVSFSCAAGVRVGSVALRGDTAGEIRVGGSAVEMFQVELELEPGEDRRVEHLQFAGADNGVLGLSFDGVGPVVRFDRIETQAQGTEIQVDNSSAQRIVFGSLGEGITRLDASASQVGVEVFSAEGSAAVPGFQFVGSSGDDTFHVRSSLAVGSVRGGAGTDTLIVGADHIPEAAKYTEFERVQLQAGVAFDFAGWDSLDEIVLNDDSDELNYALSNLSAAQAANIIVKQARADSATDGLFISLAEGEQGPIGINVTSPQAVVFGDLQLFGATEALVTSDVDVTVLSLAGTSQLQRVAFGGAGDMNVAGAGLFYAQGASLDFSACEGSVALNLGMAAPNNGGFLTILDGREADDITGSLGNDKLVFQKGADVVALGAGGDTFDFNGKKGSDVMGVGITYKVSASSSHAGARPAGETGPDALDPTDVNPLATDTIQGVDVAQFTTAAGASFLIDSDIAATSVGSANQLTFGVTEALTDKGIIIVRLQADPTTVYVVQEGGDDADKIIDRDDLMVRVVGSAAIQAFEFALDGDNVRFTSQ